MVRANGAQASIRDPTDQSNLPASAAGLAGLRPAMTLSYVLPDVVHQPEGGRAGPRIRPACVVESQFRTRAVERPDEREPSGSLSFRPTYTSRSVWQKRRKSRASSSPDTGDRRRTPVRPR